MRPAQIIPIGRHANMRNKAQNSLLSCGVSEGSGGPPCAIAHKAPNSINGQTEKFGRRRGRVENLALADRTAAVGRKASRALPLLAWVITNALPVRPDWLQRPLCATNGRARPWSPRRESSPLPVPKPPPANQIFRADKRCGLF